MTRSAIFEAVRAVKGRIDPDDVPILDAALDRIGIPPQGGAKAHTLKDPAAFFAAVRKITGPLDTEQVDTINGLLKAAAHWPIGWLAYGLATAWHEARLKPIPEWGLGKGKPYGRPGARMTAMPNPPVYGGQPPYGRGLVQLTWVDNYEWADAEAAKAGLIKKGEILANFNLVMRPDIAAFILVRGMETGAFTGKKLADYIIGRGTPAGFINGRRIINGTDKAPLIAGYAENFLVALDAGGHA